MAWHLYIAGVDRVENYISESIRLSPELTYIIDTGSLKLSGSRPVNGSEIIIVDDALGRLFAGVVKKSKLDYESQDHTMQIWMMEFTDYTDQMDKRLVTEEYTNTSGDAIFKDIALKYCKDFTTNGVATGAPTVEYIQFDHLRPSECFKKLSEYLGWDWQPDYFKDLKFFNPANSSLAPLKLEDGGAFSNFVPTIDETGLVNSVDVMGGTMLSDPINLEFKYDGKARAWTIPYKPHELKIYVSEVQKTVGIENIDNPATVDFLLNFEEQRITLGANYTCPPDGATIRQNLRYDIPVITRVEDLASQAAVKAVQGGDGVYEHFIVDNKLVTLQAAEAAGRAYLNLNANPKITGTFDTTVPGWMPGQKLPINLPGRGIVGEYKVQSVEITRIAQRWLYRITFGGRLLGVADVLAALVSKQQQADSTPAVLMKYVYVSEDIVLADEWSTKSRSASAPWICGDSDAICGEVITLASN